jgi:hypothetical protein
MAVALPGLQNSVEGDEELFKENNKTFDITTVGARTRTSQMTEWLMECLVWLIGCSLMD